RRRDRVLIPATVLAREYVGILKKLGQPFDLIGGNGNAPPGGKPVLNGTHRIGHATSEVRRFDDVQFVQFRDRGKRSVSEAQGTPFRQRVPQFVPWREWTAQPCGKLAVRNKGCP